MLYSVVVSDPTGRGVEVEAAAAMARLRSNNSLELISLSLYQSKEWNDVPLAINLAPKPPVYPLSLGAGVLGVAPGAGLHDSEGQHLPVEVLRIEARSSGESPRVDPSSIASAVPAMAIPSRRLNIARGRLWN